MTAIQYTAFMFFPLAMAYAAASDLLSMTISNKVSLILVGGFFAIAPFVPGMDLETFGLHLAAGAVVLAISFLMFGFGWIGGGDAKIAAAASMWIGFDLTIEYMSWTAIIGGGVTIVVLMMRQRVSPAFAARYSWLYRLHDPASGVPYGIALAAAALLVYPDTIWMDLVVG